MQINQINNTHYEKHKAAFGAKMFKTQAAANVMNKMGLGFHTKLEEYNPLINDIKSNNLPVNVIIDAGKRKLFGIFNIGKKFVIETHLKDEPQAKSISTIKIPNLFF